MKKRQGEVYINAASGYILVMHPALLYFQHLISIYKSAKGFKNGLDISLVIQRKHLFVDFLDWIYYVDLTALTQARVNDF
jgi:hypothetical protein